MRVCVDDAIFAFKNMVICHMFSPDLDALPSMADRIGMDRRWFQNPSIMSKVSWPHYDIAKPMRALAVSFGAIECDRLQLLAMSAIVKNRFWDTDRHDPLGHCQSRGLRHKLGARVIARRSLQRRTDTLLARRKFGV